VRQHTPCGEGVLCRNASETPLRSLRLGGNVRLDKDSERFVRQEHSLEPRLGV
jgi:hypothetical protein